MTPEETRFFGIKRECGLHDRRLKHLKNPSAMTHLDELESQSIYLMREAFHGFERPAMLWSMGKDSNVLLWLAKKAFCGHMPFPVVHIDTTYEFPEMLEFRRGRRSTTAST
jgi:3'-phosphoadenosine 5'-phosphosulfate sulfotransferase (PAPS reductase)/FAD synthetase